MFSTQLFTQSQEGPRYISRVHRVKRTAASATPYPLAIYRQGSDTVCIGIERPKGGWGQLVPYEGQIYAGNLLGVNVITGNYRLDHQKAIRQFRPLRIAGSTGFHLQCVLDPTLYVGLDGVAICLTATPCVWHLPEEDRVMLVRRRAHQIAEETGRADELANWYDAEKTLFKALPVQ